ncbi:MAG: S41 family peptidase [Candidatus Avoscillospira sp.]
MKRSVKVLLVILAIVLTAVLTCFGTCLYLTANWTPAVSADPVAAKIEELSAYVDRYFIDDYDTDAMVAAAADGAAEAFVTATGDRWSYYVSAEDMEAHNEQLYNAYVGVGITILEVEDGFQVTSVSEGGPADQAGVRVGDLLIEVESQNVVGLGLDGTRDLVRGEEGTQVQACFLRDGQRLEVTMTRASIISDVATGELLEDGIGLVTIANFDYHCAEQTLDAIQSLLDQGAKALIFDVRFNPGGLKDEMVEVLDVLLPEGDIFRSLDYDGREEVDRSDADCLELPMAVLVNEDSYSAAEFFAAALQEYGVATVVGTQTCGKGNFQYTFELSDGSAVALSVGKYFTPNGRSLTDVGVTPDVVADMDDDDYYSRYVGVLEPEDDGQLQAALEAMRKKIS